MKKENKIELIVLKSFIRVIKDNGQYVYFRFGVRNNGILSYFYKSSKSGQTSSPFSNESSFDEIAKTLEQITKEMSSGGKKKMDDYEYVTMTINHLLHFFLECHGISIEQLSSIGEEIYGISCNKLFGDEFEYSNGPEPSKMEDYFGKRGLVTGSKAKFAGDLGEGQVLGRAPEEYEINDRYIKMSTW